jgi:geranylgeranyl diphosphate synthase type I
MARTYSAAIELFLTDFFRTLPESLPYDLSATNQQALDYLAEYTLRPGKRIRGSLAAYAFEYSQHGDALEGPVRQEAIALGAAMELIQSYFLVIDDVMDRSEVRRGKPTIHKLYEKDKNFAHDPHLSDMMAFNTGLLAQNLANIIISRIPLPSERIQRVIKTLHESVLATTFGQLEDTAQHIQSPTTEADILYKQLLKSSYYTCIGPLVTGLQLGGIEDKKVLREATSFGKAGGIYHQLQDDYIGVFGDEAVTGKSSSDDIIEGKMTLFVTYSLAHASESEKVALLEVLGNPSASPMQVQRVRDIFVACGAVEYLEAQRDSYRDTARAVLGKSTFWSKQSKDLLDSMLRFSLKRGY